MTTRASAPTRNVSLSDSSFLGTGGTDTVTIGKRTSRRDVMKRISTLLAAMLLALGLSAGPALAMQPPGSGAQDNFGCLDGEDAAVAGHPGAAGLVDATPKVRALTEDDLPTAWNAFEHAEPIELGEC